MQTNEEYYTFKEYKDYIIIKNQIENEKKFNYERYKFIIFKKIKDITYFIKTIIITDKYHKTIEIDDKIKNYIDKKLQ